MSEIEGSVIHELRERQHEVYFPSQDIDVVWVLSAPGTVDTPPEKGLFKGRLIDLERVQAGIEVVKAVTAKRTGSTPEQVTKEEIEDHGPILFYNGESSDNGTYAQNEALTKLTKQTDFPLPDRNVEVQHLDEIYTPGQVKGLAKFISQRPGIRKVAVVTHAPHMRRVSRYLTKYRNLFPPSLLFEEASIPEENSPVGSVLGELKRIKAYADKGDLDPEPTI